DDASSHRSRGVRHAASAQKAVNTTTRNTAYSGLWKFTARARGGKDVVGRIPTPASRGFPAAPPCTPAPASLHLLTPLARRGGRVADGTALLRRHTGYSRIGGSNPPLSASSPSTWRAPGIGRRGGVSRPWPHPRAPRPRCASRPRSTTPPSTSTDGS